MAAIKELQESDRALIEKMLDLTQIKDVDKPGSNGGYEIQVIFSREVKEIIKELSERYTKSAIYKKSRKRQPEWVEKATAGDIFNHMCDKICEAPTRIHMIIIPQILVPIMQEKIQEEEKAQKGAENLVSKCTEAKEKANAEA